MAVHDGWARVTPYELCLPDLDAARKRFRALSEEAVTGGAGLADPARFPFLRPVAQLLHDLHGPEADAGRLHEHALLLFHAFHFWAAGERLFLLETHLLRTLLAGDPGPWPDALPAAAGYVQLPQHLVWTDPEGSEAPESVDGLFWSAPPGRGELSVLLAAGVRGDREGFSVLPLPAAPLADVALWSQARGREEGEDFASRMPGSRLDGLYQVRTAGEALKLLARTLAWLSVRPGQEQSPPLEGHPRPTRLPYRRVGLG